MLRSKDISRTLNVRIYKTMIFPIIVFASKVWRLKTTELNLFQVWETKIPHKIFGGVKVNGG